MLFIGFILKANIGVNIKKKIYIYISGFQIEPSIILCQYCPIYCIILYNNHISGIYIIYFKYAFSKISITNHFVRLLCSSLLYRRGPKHIYEVKSNNEINNKIITVTNYTSRLNKNKNEFS